MAISATHRTHQCERGIDRHPSDAVIDGVEAVAPDDLHLSGYQATP